MQGAALTLAALSGAAVMVAAMAIFTAARWQRRARIAEALLDRAAMRRSSAVSRGNLTRAANRRELVMAKMAELRAAPAEKSGSGAPEPRAVIAPLL